jgi:hypothetical protein
MNISQETPVRSPELAALAFGPALADGGHGHGAATMATARPRPRRKCA